MSNTSTKLTVPGKEAEKNNRAVNEHMKKLVNTPQCNLQNNHGRYFQVDKECEKTVTTPLEDQSLPWIKMTHHMEEIHYLLLRE